MIFDIYNQVNRLINNIQWFILNAIQGRFVLKINLVHTTAVIVFLNFVFVCIGH